ncbi:MAG: hypothetical protein IPG70_06405 [Moraxellaceae bacterium]|nr:hypothetical protein [Moraxellaceae bacterium]
MTVKKKVLNVGGNSKDIALPDIYQGWEQVWLDIDPRLQMFYVRAKSLQFIAQFRTGKKY